MNPNKTKILYIHHGTGIGGAPISLLNLVKQLNPDKFCVKIAVIKDSNVVEMFRKKGIETEVISAPNYWFVHGETGIIKWYQFFRYIKVFIQWHRTSKAIGKKYLSAQDCDIIHLNSHVLTSWASAGHNLGFKVVMHNRESIAKGYLGIRHFILRHLIERNCDAVISISKDSKRRLGLKMNSHVIYNFVTIPPSFHPCMIESGIPRKILHLGGQARIKGFETVVACLPYLDPNIRVQFAGYYGKLGKVKTVKGWIKHWVKLTVFGNTYRPLRKMYEASNAEVLGLLNDPLPVIDACDILITPFKVEHFSRPAIEAFAYGKPVIGSNVEGMDEIIDHGVNGLLVEKDNPKALAQAINYLCANPDIARKMGEAGREKAEKIFSPEINTSKVEAIYDSLMAPPPNSRDERPMVKDSLKTSDSLRNRR